MPTSLVIAEDVASKHCYSTETFTIPLPGQIKISGHEISWKPRGGGGGHFHSKEIGMLVVFFRV